MGENFSVSFSTFSTNSFSGGSPRRGSMVSLQDLIPLLKMKTATISPPIPSRGKFVNLPAIIEIITIVKI